MVHHYWPMHKINGHLDSRPWHALTISSFLSSVCCKRGQNRSQCVPPKRTCKKVFGLHLSNTVSFLVSHIAQHKEATPVNSIKLWLWLPYFDQPLNKSVVLCGGESPNTICTARRKNWHNDFQNINVGWFLVYCKSNKFYFLSNFSKLNFLSLRSLPF